MFTILAQSDEPKTVPELAAVTGSEAELLGRYFPLNNKKGSLQDTGRLLKHLGAMEVIVETAPDTYRRNGFTTTLSMPRYSDAFPCMYVFILYHILLYYANPTPPPSLAQSTNMSR